tara:strand:- start:18104 stop:18244 length:141 start_codon:yes stop_codon:yes gene_type:complete
MNNTKIYGILKDSGNPMDVGAGVAVFMLEIQDNGVTHIPSINRDIR